MFFWQILVLFLTPSQLQWNGLGIAPRNWIFCRRDMYPEEKSQWEINNLSIIHLRLLIFINSSTNMVITTIKQPPLVAWDSVYKDSSTMYQSPILTRPLYDINKSSLWTFLPMNIEPGRTCLMIYHGLLGQWSAEGSVYRVWWVQALSALAAYEQPPFFKSEVLRIPRRNWQFCSRYTYLQNCLMCFYEFIGNIK